MPLQPLRLRNAHSRRAALGRALFIGGAVLSMLGAAVGTSLLFAIYSKKDWRGIFLGLSGLVGMGVYLWLLAPLESLLTPRIELDATALVFFTVAKGGWHAQPVPNRDARILAAYKRHLLIELGGRRRRLPRWYLDPHDARVTLVVADNRLVCAPAA